MIYLGLDISRLGNCIRLHQETYASRKLHEVDLGDIYRENRFKITSEKRRSITKQVIGALVWTSQTRSDYNPAIAELSSSAVDAAPGEKRFRMWIEKSNGVVRKLKESKAYINSKSPLAFVPKNPMSIITQVQMFCFVDASHASLPGSGSLQSYVLLAGRVKRRDGDIVAQGCLLDCASYKIRRVCKSSLSAEVSALGNGIDVALWSRVLWIEIASGRFLKELLEANESYVLQTPFGAAPAASEVRQEVSEIQ